MTVTWWCDRPSFSSVNRLTDRSYGHCGARWCRWLQQSHGESPGLAKRGLGDSEKGLSLLQASHFVLLVYSTVMLSNKHNPDFSLALFQIRTPQSSVGRLDAHESHFDRTGPRSTKVVAAAGSASGPLCALPARLVKEPRPTAGWYVFGGLEPFALCGSFCSLLRIRCS